MKPLQEHAHLFANGKFKVNHIKDDYEPFVLAGVIQSKDGTNWIVQDAEWSYPVEDCTLIARPTEAMTDEEVWGYFDSYKDGSGEEYRDFNFTAEQVKGMIREACRSDTLSRDQTIYLLSIGVYPFDQIHFKDGTVIDSREVE